MLPACLPCWLLQMLLLLSRLVHDALHVLSCAVLLCMLVCC
jgi:hypothetical protein